MVDAGIAQAKNAANREQQTQASQQYSPLFLFFWLPSGKDAFGFKDWHDARLNILEKYHKGIYSPIGLHFKDQYLELNNKNAFNGCFRLVDGSDGDEDSEFLSIDDAKLGVRKIVSNFVYYPDFNNRNEKKDTESIANNQNIMFPERIEGRFYLFSSGLYVWRFNIPYENIELLDPKNGKTRQDIKDFFEQKFFNDVLTILFDLDWQKFDAFQDGSGHRVLHKHNGGAGRTYQGVLNYYQLELLYNHVFALETCPQLFFIQSTRSDQDTSVGSSDLVDRYSLNNLLRSISIVSWGRPKRKYFLLGSERKDYSLRGPCEVYEDAYFSPEDFIYEFEDRELEDTNEIEDYPHTTSGTMSLVLREHFYARLHFAAMEQFMRVAITFGLMPYREGLESARKVVLLHNFRTKENLEPDQLYRESNVTPDLPPEDGVSPSGPASSTVSSDTSKNDSARRRIEKLEVVTCTPSYAEIYYELIKNKIPGLRLIQSFLHDVSKVIAPAEVVDKADLKRMSIDDAFDQSKIPKKSRSLCEYYYSRETLREAEYQFNRQIEAIENEAEALRYLMERSGDRNILNELVETRKIHELEAEEQLKVKIDPNQWSQFSIGLSIIAMGLALALAVWQTGIEIIGHLLSKDSAWGPDSAGAPPDYLLIAIVFLVTVVAAIVVGRGFYSRAKSRLSGLETPLPAKSSEFSTNIYDFANLRERLDLRHVEKVFELWQEGLLYLFDADSKKGPCRLFNVLSEMPTIGMEKRKYSFRSPEHENESNYTLHVEIEMHLPTEELYWTDMRLAIRTLPGKQNIKKEKERLISYYVAMLLKSGKDDMKMKEILSRHFGIR